MADKLHYPDLFTNINIPEDPQQFSRELDDLLVFAQQPNDGSTSLFLHLENKSQTAEATHARWSFEQYEETPKKHLLTRDLLAITSMKELFSVGIEHRSFDDSRRSFRKSLLWAKTRNPVNVYDVDGVAHRARLSEYDLSYEAFVEDFYTTTVANLALSDHILRLRAVQAQNESSSAIFASAA